MQDYFGLNSVFVTVTPCDECSFRVRLLTRPGVKVSFIEHEDENLLHVLFHLSIFLLKVPLPNLTMSKDDCIADLKLRTNIRLEYQGACSLEYQNLKKIILETLFNWNTKE